MLFNTFEFAIFLPIVFVIYWYVSNKNLRLQNLIIVVASYVFYGWWDWRFLILIVFSTIVDYLLGLHLSKTSNKFKRKELLITSIVLNLGILGFFKYFNFFIDSFKNAFSVFGYELTSNSLNIILPVGISFYTFQTLSYLIDVYRKKIKPTTDYVAFSAFVCFFPQLVAGPIERASNLLPQFLTNRKFNYLQATNGAKQILWGLFKKIVIADQCAIYANEIFNNYSEYSGSSLLLGAFFYAIQIYGDFSGYTDIAIGTSKLFGFNLMQNFAFPYFSRDIAEFWRKWHISLTSWFRDYLYIPLGGSGGNKLLTIRNVFIVFLVSGFWHGANWTFIFWGLLNALYFIPLLLFKTNRKNLNTVAEGKLLPSMREFLSMGITFSLTVFAWILFRSESLLDAFNFITRIFRVDLFAMPDFPKLNMDKNLFLLIFFFFAIEWFGRFDQFAIDKLLNKKKPVIRYLFYYLIFFLIIWYKSSPQDFIYFQF